MNRISTRTIVVGIIAILAVISCDHKEIITKKPNVLMISIDDLNNYLGFLGDQNAITPNLDRLASQGVAFSNAHCQAPLCGPSRASIMTGLRPSTSGIYGMIKDDKIAKDNETTKNITFLPQYFRENGYETYGVGKLFHTFAPDGQFEHAAGRFAGEKPNHNFGVAPLLRMEWDGYAPEGSGRYGRTSTDWGPFPEHDSLMTDTENVSWALNKVEKHNDESPFFMAVGFLRPHVPWHVPQKWFDLYPLENILEPPYLKGDLDDVPALVREKLSYLPMMPSTDWAIETKNWKKIIQAYLACVSYVDDQVGRLIATLEENGYSENTIVVLWSDHGYRVGEKGSFAKHALWEEATNAPLIFSGPKVPSTITYTHPVEMLDIYPTLVELAGLPAVHGIEGKSLLSRMLQPAEGLNDYATTTYGWSNHSIRNNEWRYSRYEDGSQELYDKKLDPNEFKNLALDSDYDHIKEELTPLFPQVNKPWHEHSNYTFDQYFVDQKERIKHLNKSKK